MSKLEKVIIQEFEGGVKKCRMFKKLIATETAIRVEYSEFLELPDGSIMGEEIKQYDESPDRVEYWNDTLGYPMIMPAINLKLSTLDQPINETEQ